MTAAHHSRHSHLRAGLWQLQRIALLFALAEPIVMPASEQPLFDSEDELVIRIEAPIRALERQRQDDPPWLEGRLVLLGSGQAEVSFDIKIKARGNFRRQSHNCQFPPFWVNFKKSQVKGTLFENQDRLKVVSHCRERESFYGTYLPREYLVYKTYNLITEASFRVRLARIEYVATDRRMASFVRPAFLIEHPSMVAERLHGERVKDRMVPPVLIDETTLNRADFFQYMIGNTDYSFVLGADECCHNSRVFIIEGRDAGFLPVPYDFDSTGVVDPPYAKTNPSLKIDSVRTRVYRGVQVSQAVFDDTIDFYLQKEDAILALWRNSALLSERDRNRCGDYLEEFFEILKYPDAIYSNIIRRTRGAEALTDHLSKMDPEAIKQWETDLGGK